MRISLVRLSTKNLATLAQRAINSSKTGAYKVAESHPLLENLEQVYQKYDGLYAKQTFSGKGVSVAEADEKRDKSFVSIRNFLNGYRQVPSAIHADKAEELFTILKGFGTDIERLNYAEETAQMKKLIEEFDKEANKEKLTALSLATAFEELKKHQQDFEKLFAEQAEANSELRKTPSASTMRRELESALKTYLDFLSVMKNIAPWTDLYQEIYELVKAARKG